MIELVEIPLIGTYPKVPATPTEMNLRYSPIIENLNRLNAGKMDGITGAQLNSPAFTGAPTAPTQPPGDDSTKIATTAFVQAAIASAMSIMPIVPTGTVIHVAMSTAPPGFLKADGSTVSRSVYAALFSVIGVTFGIGDAVSSFKLPDLRGEFIRGWGLGRDVDIGRALGSNQSNALEMHNHYLPTTTDNPGSTWGLSDSSPTWSQRTVNRDAVTDYAATTYPDDRYSNPEFTGSKGTYGTETRPRNVALLACIKY